MYTNRLRVHCDFPLFKNILFNIPFFRYCRTMITVERRFMERRLTMAVNIATSALFTIACNIYGAPFECKNRCVVQLTRGKPVDFSASN